MAVKDQVQGWSLTHNLIESAWKHQTQLLTVHSPFPGERHGGQKASESCSGLYLSIRENVFTDVYDSTGRESEVGLRVTSGWVWCESRARTLFPQC